MLCLGIDPGISGGLARIETEPVPTILSGIRMPWLQHGKKSKIIDVMAIREWLPRVRGVRVAVIENVHSMPKQGVASSFAFGRSLGAVEALAHLTCSRVAYVTPAVWKRGYGFPKGATKRASMDRAKIEFGDSFGWKTLADNGIAEAALIALHHARQS